nr:LOW QUALITY PROTEIN: LIM/homeobox protein Lhx3 [Vicugna pacos]
MEARGELGPGRESAGGDLLLALLARREDLRREIPLCAGCDQHILDRFILKALDRHWHSKCLKCSDCHTPLAERCFSRGESVYCKDDFFKQASRSSTEAGCTPQGLRIPFSVVRVALLRLPGRRPGVWFQNRRAKEKRLKKDAGRQRWGQYFRNMKRARGGSKSDKDSVQEEGQDSDAEVSFTDEPSMAEMGPANGLYSSLGEPAPALGRTSGAPGSFPLEHGGLAGPEQYRELRPGSPYGVPPSPAALQSLPGPQPLLSSLVYPDASLGLVPAGAPGGPPPMRVLAGNGPSSDLSTGSSGGYPDFPASPASWLDEVDHAQF